MPVFDDMAGSPVARVAAVAGVLAAMVSALLVVPGDASAVSHRAGPRSASAQASEPNVLIIVTDDQRADLMKFMPRTRRIFGDRGVRFRRAFATTPLCCPFRASLMTGQFAHNSGVRRQEDGPSINQQHTMQRYLHDAGYTTAMIGKYLNNWPRGTPPPHFDRFSVGKLYDDQLFNVDGKLKRIDRYAPDYLASRAARLLREFEADDAKPWFMLLAPSNPHSPSTAARRHRDVHIPLWQGNPATNEKDLSDKPRVLYGGRRPSRAKPKTTLYGKMARSLLSADELVAGVDRAMRGLDEKSNTLAFFVSDNGFALGEHGMFAKKKPYPIASRVPLYMRWPRGPVERGGLDNRLVANIDILPTILEAIGLSPVPGHTIDGRSLQGTLRRSRMLVEAFAPSSSYFWASLITDEEQYTEYYDGNETVDFREYYDLDKDPWYLKNTLGDDRPSNDPSPQTLEGLESQLEADRVCAGANCP